jgi:LEA14-like dessication related protein
MPAHHEPPRLSVVDLRVVDATLLSQTYRIRLRIQNPNSFALPIDGMAYELRINDQPFASGVSNQSLDVPRYGTEELEVQAVSTLAAVFRQLNELERSGPERFRYALKGHVSLAGGDSRVPFEEAGEISLRPPGARGDSEDR